MRSKVAMLVILTACLQLTCSSHSLGAYKGSAKDLLAAHVGEYDKSEEGPSEVRVIHDNKSSLHLNESEAASYSKGKDTKQVFLLVMTFDSPENSHKAFTLLTRSLSREDDLKDISEKKKGWSSVGERLEVNIANAGPDSGDRIIWRNGSVLFMLNGDPKRTTIVDLRKFEESLNY